VADDNRSHGERTRAGIIAAGLALWRETSANVSARAIGKATGLTHSAVLYHYGTSDALKDAIAREAVRIGDPVIVPDLIVSKNAAAASISDEDRRRFLAGC